MEIRKPNDVCVGLEPIFKPYYERRINMGKDTVGKSAAIGSMKKLGSVMVSAASAVAKVNASMGNFIVNGNFTIHQRGADMEVRYIKREEVKVKIERFNKKFKGKYRFKAYAYAPLHWEDTPDPEGTTSFTAYSSWGRNDKNQEMTGSEVLSKTRQGAETSAINQLLQQCRPPLSRKQKLSNKGKLKVEKRSRQYKNGLRETGEKVVYERQVHVEVRVSNSLDFIMNDDSKSVWHEIRKEK